MPQSTVPAAGRARARLSTSKQAHGHAGHGRQSQQDFTRLAFAFSIGPGWPCTDRAGCVLADLLRTM
eukprot:4976955-Alexandrium_andersonii.AAC.1